MKDPFEILGLSPDAGEEEIKKVYRKLALEHHPDRHPDDKEAEERFKEINNAYTTLKNNNWKKEEVRDFGGFGGVSVEDIFNQMFNGNPFGRSQRSIKTGNLYITLEEAYSGCEKKVQIKDFTNCSVCSGKGIKLANEICPDCKGTGQNRKQHGAISMMFPCNACRGFGKKISSICDACKGKGKVENIKEFSIKIPAGIEHGTRLKPANDVQIQILYAPHNEYKIMENMNIISEKEISMFDAILGGVITINTLNGTKNVKIPAGSQPGTMLRIARAGMKTNRRTGDHLIDIHVKLPNKLTKEEKKLFMELKQMGEKNGEDRE